MDARWWQGWRSAGAGERLSVLQLVKAGTLDLRLAALLWLLMEYRTSVVVAAGPSMAGKTTLLNALLDFLRPEVRLVYLQGQWERFEFVGETEPSGTYLVADEISDHFMAYLWGHAARRMFELLPRGYAFGGTMHARTAGEVVDTLGEDLGLPVSLLAHLGTVITLGVTWGRSNRWEPVRRVETVSMVGLGKGGLSIERLAFRSPGGAVAELAGEEELGAALSTRLGAERGGIAREIQTRRGLLAALVAEGRLSSDEVRKAVLDFYNR